MNAWLGKVWQNLHGGQRGAIANWFVMAFAGVFISIVLTIAIPIMMTTQDRMDLGEALSVLKEYGYVAYGDPSGDWTTLGSLYTKNIYPQADSTYGIGSTTNRYLRGWYDNLVASNITGTVGNFTNVNSDTLAASGLTSGRIPIAGAGGLLGDDADLTFTGGNTLTATIGTFPTLNAPTGRTATLTVSASVANGATQLEYDQADYKCDGTADDVQIQAAITALPALGGKILFSTGSFYCTSNIDLPASKPTWIEGAGQGASKVYFSGIVVANNWLFNAGSPAVNTIDITFRNFTIINTNATASQDFGIFPTWGVSTHTGWLVENMEFDNCGIGTGEGTIRNNYFHDLTSGGAVGGWAVTTPSNSYIYGNLFRHLAGMAIAGNTATNVHIYGNTVIDAAQDFAAHAIDISANTKTVIQGNIINNKYGINVENSVGTVTISDNIITGNGVDGWGISVHRTAVGEPKTKNILIDNNIVDGFNTGLRVVDIDDAIISNNKILNTIFGVDIHATPAWGTAPRKIQFLNNDILHWGDYQRGLATYMAGNIDIVGNNFDGTGTTSGIGILLYASSPSYSKSSASILNNRIINCTPFSIDNLNKVYMANNVGYIASGEIRTTSEAINAGTVGNAVFVWQNPETQAVLTSAKVKVTTRATAAGVLGAIGVATLIGGGQLEDCETNWTIHADSTGDATAIAGTEHADRGTNAVAVAITTAVGANKIVAFSTDPTNLDLSTATHITLKILSTTVTTAGQYQIGIDQANDMGTAVFYDLPALVANRMTLVCLNLNGGAAVGAGANSISAVGIKDVTGTGTRTIYLDDIRAVTFGTTLCTAAGMDLSTSLKILDSMNVADAGAGQGRPIIMSAKNATATTSDDILAMISSVDASTGIVGTYYIQEIGQ
jgi:hypothetical protein